ncbi:MAG TPA: 3-deoxy-D-manno-octulosonic acid transferase [Geminicoccaceae bacterium]|nr:3-deoxy-D-manno-octulosonic acid transferase [Geminicoccaceae bacterium]
MLLSGYRVLGRTAAPLVRVWLRRRVAQGREDPVRLPERLGVASLPRPAGRVLWFHAVSIGEALAVLPLIEAVGARLPRATALLTTATATSQRLLAPRLPAGVLHQMAPVDLPVTAGRFLDHWRPDLAIFVGSELWPNLLGGLRARGCPAVLVDGRLSDHAFGRWRLVRGAARRLLGGFALVLAQTPREAERFRELGAAVVEVGGELKRAAGPLPAEPARLEELRRALAGRRVWVAASTHAGEELVVARAHRRVAEGVPSLLTVLVPRHPERAAAIARLLGAEGLRCTRRSVGEPVTAATEVLLADTLGELGLWYRLAEVALVGGTLAGRGGHNLLEPARLGCPVIAGPDTRNHATAANALERAGALVRVRDRGGLAAAMGDLLADPARRCRMAAAGAAVAAEGSGLAAALRARLEPWLTPLGERVR